jgi:hypothetical protein
MSLPTFLGSGEGAGEEENQKSGASFEQVFWRAEKNTGVILDHKPLSYPSQKKQCKMM